MKRPEIRYARSGDLRIAYQIVGQGSVDLVFVAGFLSNLDLHWEDPGYAHLIRRLSTFARVIQFDKRGTGLSDRINKNDSPGLSERMDDLRAVMDAAGSERAAILAASEGVPIAMQFAATYPQRTKALILYAAYANFLKSVLGAEAAERFAVEAERSWGSGATLRAFAPGKVNDPQFSAWWARLERQTCSPSAAAQLARLEAHVNVQPLLAQIQAPTLILHRLSDARVNAAAGRYLAQHIKGARFVALSGKDNPIWAGDGDAVADEVEGFLTGTPPHSDGRRVLAALLTVRTCGPGAGRMRLADANWRDAVERLGAAAEGIARSHGGVSLRPPGEPILMRFDAPARAATAAVLLREVARGMKLVVAQGLHVGEVEPGAEAATSTALWVTEAIAQAAQSDDILASGTAADLSAGSGQRFAEHAALTIPGEERPTRIFSLIVEQHLEPAHAKPAPLEPDLAVLSQREREVLDLVAIGLSTSGIALRLRLSDHTVKRHVSNILTKLDLPNRASATALLARQQS